MIEYANISRLTSWDSINQVGLVSHVDLYPYPFLLIRCKIYCAWNVSVITFKPVSVLSVVLLPKLSILFCHIIKMYFFVYINELFSIHCVVTHCLSFSLILLLVLVSFVLPRFTTSDCPLHTFGPCIVCSPTIYDFWLPPSNITHTI